MSKKKKTLKDLMSLIQEAEAEEIKAEPTPEPSPEHPGGGTPGWVVTADYEKNYQELGGNKFRLTETPIFKVVQVQSASKYWTIQLGDHWRFRGLNGYAPVYGVFVSESAAKAFLSTLDPENHKIVSVDYRSGYSPDYEPNYGWMDQDRTW